MSGHPFAVVLGATSLVGPYLCERLSVAGFLGDAISRRPPTDEAAMPAGFRWRRLDIQSPGGWRVPAGTVILSLVPLWRLSDALPSLEAARHIIVVGTTSVFSKATSADPREADLVARIATAEERVQQFCRNAGCSWTVLRPTLIYDPGRDRNISEIARVIRRFGFFPIVRPGNGLRQPVHADDVAQAMVAAIDNPDAWDRAFNLPGGETLPYREMVCRIFSGLGQRPAILPVPGSLLRMAFAAARPIYGGRYSPALLARMNQDLAFDGRPAQQALRFDPRPFRPVFPAG
ncbi:NAD-dependent epimerase/dehydratase family protein [Rhodospirillaceae bacterium SYSU D60014]|uniref:NAD-dependent epimerase/dehydratase family protein n=1 Tax=Virgifigura deserti TaxID=2268457 RepID=UPI000E6606CE